MQNGVWRMWLVHTMRAHAFCPRRATIGNRNPTRSQDSPRMLVWCSQRGKRSWDGGKEGRDLSQSWRVVQQLYTKHKRRTWEHTLPYSHVWILILDKHSQPWRTTQYYLNTVLRETRIKKSIERWDFLILRHVWY